MSGFGTGAGADMLQEILLRKFREQATMRELANRERETELQNQVAQGQLGLGRQRLSLDTDKLGEDRRQFDEQAPVRIATARHTDASTEALNRQPVEAEKARTFTAGESEKGRVFQGGQGDLNRGNAVRLANINGQNALRVARERASDDLVRVTTRDANGDAVTRFVPKSEAAGQEFSAAPTAQQRDRSANAGRANPVVQSIAELSERINTGRGALAKIAGAAERAKAEANLNDDVSEYQAVVSGFTPLLARAMGHTGVLTEQDVQSVRKMLPAVEDSKSVRDRKIARIESLLGAQSGAQAPGGGDPLGIRR